MSRKGKQFFIRAAASAIGSTIGILIGMFIALWLTKHGIYP